MYFNSLVDEILKESKIKPVLDGEREIYMLVVRVDQPPVTWKCNFRRLAASGINGLEHVLNNEEHHVDVKYVGRNVQELLNQLDVSIKQHCQFIYKKDYINNFKQSIKDLLDQDVECIWYLLDTTYTSGIVKNYIYVEIDVAATRAKRIQHTLSRYDSTGLEDLF